MDSGSYIADLIKPFFNDHNKSVLDIGCANGKYLYGFLDLGYTKLTGVDIYNNKFRLWEFLKHRFQESGVFSCIVDDEELIINLDNKEDRPKLSFVKKYAPEVYQDYTDIRFINRSIIEINLRSTYDTIILSNVAHLINPEEREILVSKINNALNVGGLLYLSANTLERMPKYSDRFYEKTKQIDYKTYQSLALPNKTFHLFEDSDFDLFTRNFAEVHKIDDGRAERFNEIFICRK